MNIYLVQHGQANPKTIDPTRSLSELGRQEVEQIAAFARQLGLTVGQIRHSGKERAEQTAVILGQALTPPEGVIATSGLAPLDDVRSVAETLAQETQPLMLVGHLPFMERLAGHLVTGAADQPIVKFCNGGIVCLTLADDQWLMSWILTPAMASM